MSRAGTAVEHLNRRLLVALPDGYEQARTRYEDLAPAVDLARVREARQLGRGARRDEGASPARVCPVRELRCSAFDDGLRVELARHRISDGHHTIAERMYRHDPGVSAARTAADLAPRRTRRHGAGGRPAQPVVRQLRESGDRGGGRRTRRPAGPPSSSCSAARCRRRCVKRLHCGVLDTRYRSRGSGGDTEHVVVRSRHDASATSAAPLDTAGSRARSPAAFGGTLAATLSTHCLTESSSAAAGGHHRRGPIDLGPQPPVEFGEPGHRRGQVLVVVRIRLRRGTGPTRPGMAAETVCRDSRADRWNRIPPHLPAPRRPAWRGHCPTSKEMLPER